MSTTATVLAFPQPNPTDPTAQPTHVAAVPSLFVVPKPFQSQPLTAASIKAAFRQRANELGIDAERGSTAYQAANVRAMNSKRSHYARTRAQVEAHAAAHPLNYDNGSGAVDLIKVEKRARRDWWTEDSRRFIQGPPLRTVLPDAIDLHGHVDSPTEFVAIANVRRAAVEAETERDVERKYNRVELLNDLSPRRYFQMRRRDGRWAA